MSREADLMLVLLGLQMKTFTQAQVVECGAVWAQDRSARFADLLQGRGYLDPAMRSALDVLVRNQLERAGGDPAKSLAALPVQEETLRTVLALPADPAVHATLLELAARPAAEGGPEHAAAGPGPEPSPGPSAADRYVLGAEIGRGGLGRVVSARDRVLGREVAVKEMTGDPGRSKHWRRFLREGEIAGRLSHPNVVPVHDVGVREERGRRVPFFVMSLIRGRDLKEVLRAVAQGAFPDDPRRDPPEGILAAAAPPDLPGRLPRHGLRARPRRDPPRPEARQRHDRRLRRGLRGGLGPRQDRGRG